VEAGGGGYGDPKQRAPAEVEDDVAQGYVSKDAAKQVYGWRS
jgi:N-methylhydantoinase B